MLIIGWMVLKIFIAISDKLASVPVRYPKTMGIEKQAIRFPLKKIFRASEAEPPSILAIAGAAFAGGQSAIMAPPSSTSRGRPNSSTTPARMATSKRLTTSARISILKVYPCVCGGILVTNVRNIIEPIKNGIMGESTWACGKTIPSRIASGINMARKFFIARRNLEKRRDGPRQRLSSPACPSTQRNSPAPFR